MSESTGSHDYHLSRLLLVSGIIAMVTGLGLVALYLVTQTQPGGPACMVHQPCQTSWWYYDSTRLSEVKIAFPLFVVGTVLLVIAAARRS
jgi:hypothetical protein